MKIAIITYYFLPNKIGGIEIATYNIAKQLAKRGNEVHIITSYNKEINRESKENGFYIHRIDYEKVKFLGILYFWGKIVLCLKKVNPDVIHIQSIAMGIPGYLAKVFMKKPYLVWGHGSEVYLPWKFKKIISKIVIENADAVIALSRDMKDHIINKGNRSVTIIPNGIDIEMFKNAPKKLAPVNEAKTILFVGTLHNVKGIFYLIDAIKIVKQIMPNVRLLIVGDGKDREKLKETVVKTDLQKYIYFVGRVPNEKIPVYMACSDIFVLPSISEGLPVAILEAMASGLPIIATEVGGIPEVVKDGINGFLIQPKNSEDIATKIIAILKDDELRKRISNNNIKESKEYSWEAITKRIEDVYIELITTFYKMTK